MRANPGPDRVTPREIEEDGSLRRLLLAETRWFGIEHVTAGGTCTFSTALPGEGDEEGEDRWYAVMVLSGSGTVRALMSK